MKHPILIYIIFALVYFFLDAWHDSEQDKHRKAISNTEKKKHSTRWHRIDSVIKGLVGALLAVFLFGFTIMALKYFFLFLIIRWIWFDPWLNIFRGLSITYIGKTAFLDRIFKTNWMQFVFKFILLIVIIALL